MFAAFSIPLPIGGRYLEGDRQVCTSERVCYTTLLKQQSHIFKSVLSSSKFSALMKHECWLLNLFRSTPSLHLHRVATIFTSKTESKGDTSVFTIWLTAKLNTVQMGSVLVRGRRGWSVANEPVKMTTQIIKKKEAKMKRGLVSLFIQEGRRKITPPIN